MTTEPKQKPKYEIPPEHFDDDLPFREATGPGVDHASKLIKDAQDKAKPKK
jgi:hypothetical protein